MGGPEYQRFSRQTPLVLLARSSPAGCKIEVPAAMRTLRARLVVFTLMLLAQQALALALAGALACCNEPPEPATARMECCKDAGDGHMCPLARQRADDRGCRMKKGCTTDETRALAGAGFVWAAPLLARFSFVQPLVPPQAWRFVLDEERTANAPPRTPPPKA
jgi:hypothetical protein